MMDHTELKKGVYVVFDAVPHEVLEASHTFKGRGSSTVAARLRNLKTGNVAERTFHTGDQLELAELEKQDAQFVYANRGRYVFAAPDDPGERFELTEEVVGQGAKFLKEKTPVQVRKFKGEVIGVILPIKVELEVAQAPPGVQGDRAQGGTKTVVLETGASLNTPLFVGAGDVVEVNTEKSEYVRRVQE